MQHLSKLVEFYVSLGYLYHPNQFIDHPHLIFDVNLKSRELLSFFVEQNRPQLYELENIQNNQSYIMIESVLEIITDIFTYSSNVPPVVKLILEYLLFVGIYLDNTYICNKCQTLDIYLNDTYVEYLNKCQTLGIYLDDTSVEYSNPNPNPHHIIQQIVSVSEDNENYFHEFLSPINRHDSFIFLDDFNIYEKYTIYSKKIK